MKTNTSIETVSKNIFITIGTFNSQTAITDKKNFQVYEIWWNYSVIIYLI